MLTWRLKNILKHKSSHLVCKTWEYFFKTDLRNETVDKSNAMSGDFVQPSLH